MAEAPFDEAALGKAPLDEAPLDEAPLDEAPVAGAAASAPADPDRPIKPAAEELRSAANNVSRRMILPGAAMRARQGTRRSAAMQRTAWAKCSWSGARSMIVEGHSRVTLAESRWPRAASRDCDARLWSNLCGPIDSAHRLATVGQLSGTSLAPLVSARRVRPNGLRRRSNALWRRPLSSHR